MKVRILCRMLRVRTFDSLFRRLKIIYTDLIDKYNANPNVCKCCGKQILANYEDDIYRIKRKQFCNHSCAASYNNSFRKKVKDNLYCINCGKILHTGKKFCSLECQHDYKYKEFIEKWKNNEVNADGKEDTIWKTISKYIRRYLFEKYDNKCSRCGWSEINPFSKTIPLEIEHIDGDSTNNTESNLTLLCPNCHSLTSTYKGLNKGNGTRKRTWIPTL